MCKIYTGYYGTSEIELAKARGLSLRTGAQTMLFLSPISPAKFMQKLLNTS